MRLLYALKMAQKFVYPLARRDESLFDCFGQQKITDPYRWLENPDDAETEDYVAKLNAVSQPFLNSCLVKAKINKRLTELWDFPKYGCPRKEGDYYFYHYNSGLQNQSVLYIQENLKSEGAVFLDANQMSADGTISVTSTEYSEDGSLLAYAVSESGSDWMTLKFKKIPSGEELPDVLYKLRYSSLSWTHDNKGIFYTMYPMHSGDAVGKCISKNEYHTLYYHVLGTQQQDDILCFDFPENPNYMIGTDVTEDGKYLIISVNKGCDPMNLLFYYELSLDNKISGRLSLIPLIDQFEAKYDFVTNENDTFIIITNDDAPLFKLIQIDITKPNKKNWKDLVAEKPDAKLDWACCVDNDKLVLCYMKDVKNILKVHDLKTGSFLYEIPLKIGAVGQFSAKKKYSEIFYGFESFLCPMTIYRCDLSLPSPEPELFRSSELKGVNEEDFETIQAFVPSKDGTVRVPMFIVHKKGIALDGTHPTILYAYGGFNVSLLPHFRVSRLLWNCNLGGIFALANLRGGSEYGERWHEAGMKENKQNVFDDLISTAEYLINMHYTSNQRLVIHGGSNGGLLVAACANQRPDLFAAVINEVGVLDMLRFHRFTIGEAWVPEFGNPDDLEDFVYIYKYSPLHNLWTPSATRQYPAMLLLTADHDDRVVPLHSLKYIAELYYKVNLGNGKKHQLNPLLIRIETKAGHGAGKPTSKVIEQITYTYCFITLVLNLKWID